MCVQSVYSALTYTLGIKIRLLTCLNCSVFLPRFRVFLPNSAILWTEALTHTVVGHIWTHFIGFDHIWSLGSKYKWPFSHFSYIPSVIINCSLLTHEFLGCVLLVYSLSLSSFVSFKKLISFFNWSSRVFSFTSFRADQVNQVDSFSAQNVGILVGHIQSSFEAQSCTQG